MPFCCDRYAQCQTVYFLGSVIDMPVIARQGRRHPCRDAEALLMVQVIFQTTEIPQLQSIETVFDVCCAGPAISGADWEKTGNFSCNSLLHDVVATCPLCATTDAWWSECRKLRWSRSCCSRGVELIVASCHRSLKSCSACRRCISCGCGCAWRALCTCTGPWLSPP